jgi:hypothetical protein
MKLPSCSFLLSAITSSPLSPNTIFSTLLSIDEHRQPMFLPDQTLFGRLQTADVLHEGRCAPHQQRLCPLLPYKIRATFTWEDRNKNGSCRDETTCIIKCFRQAVFALTRRQNPR